MQFTFIAISHIALQKVKLAKYHTFETGGGGNKMGTYETVLQ